MSCRARPASHGFRLAGFALLPFLFAAPSVVPAQTANHEPDTPAHILGARRIDKESYMRHRAEQIGRMRGLEEGKDQDPQLRQAALAVMQRQKAGLAKGSPPVWTEIGPAPIPNGQTVTTTTAVSGRVISIAVHPTNPDIVYVGTASGGLYRSTNGGTTWTTMMDSAASLAIGSLAIAPSQPDTLYVGTGEQSFSADSFFGVGLYRITNASTASPTLAGPFNQNGAAANVFTGRSISAIRVHPTDPATIFVSTSSGLAGMGGVLNPTLPSRGVYRSTNATAASPTFEKLTGLAANANVAVRDMIIDPANPDLLICNVVAAGGVGGIYRSTNATTAVPTFTQEEIFNSSSTSELTAEFAIRHGVGDPEPVIYAATGNLGGRVLMSVNSGDTWTQQIDNNFCTPQCFYDIAIAVDPTNAARVYLGGSPALPFGISTTSGTAFSTSANGLHVDSHVIAVAPSNPSVIYFGSDGGIYRSSNSGTSWNVLNNSGFRATQFMSIATHPTHHEFMIGGTQDNGTNMRETDADWLRVDGGDGGFTAIDQTAADTSNVRMYHTYFNAPDLMGYGTVGTVAQATSMSWNFRGCQVANATTNGITCTGSVLFYAPLVLGPGSPNTVYYGTDRLYRSIDNGANHTVVSQAPITVGVPISAITIAANNDNVRFVGLLDGGLFRVTDGSTTLVNVDSGNTIPNLYIGRLLINPDNNDIAYVALAGFPTAGQNIWKTTNFLSASPTWTASGSGIPSIPVNALTFDPDDSNTVFAGTDIGVYMSSNGGVNWSPFGTGMPSVPVFGLEFNGPNNGAGKGPLRAATHGRGIWQVTLPSLDNIFSDSFE
jgi:photosystem II stability/assembly factor-like uncharacterized protein